jgi:competence protein ComEC
MVAGGLWLTLWPSRARSLGFLAIAAGLALAPTLRRPDMIVGRDGALVVVRGDDSGRYTALASRSSNFELKRWLEYDGDPRAVKAAMYNAKTPADVHCDHLACNTGLKKRVVAIVRHPAALRDDCDRADLLVLDIPRPKGCDKPQTVIDFYSLRRLGTHAVYLEGADKVRIETVAQYRGDRPWSKLPPLPVPQVVSRDASVAKTLAAEEPAALRPEIENDEQEERLDQ